MDTFELIMAIRDQLLEYDTDPISNASIMRKLNMIYTYMYSHIVRAEDTRFGQKVDFPLTASTTEYDLPKAAWGQRIEQLVVPYPSASKVTALGWNEIKRVDYKEVFKYDVPRIHVYVPEVWSQLGSKVYVFPKLYTNADAYIIISPQLVPLGITSGQITAINTGTGVITLDNMNDTSLATRLALPLNAFLSIIDYRTGEIKYTLNYSTVSGNDVTLRTPLRSSYMGQTISTPSATVLAGISQDDYVVPGVATCLSIMSTEYDQFMVNAAVLMIRSSINETDSEVLNFMKENMAQLKSDTAGRPVGVHIKREFGRGASYSRAGRR